MSVYIKAFDKAKWMLFVIDDKQLLKSTMKCGIKSAILCKKGLYTQCTKRNIWKLN